MRNKVKKDQRKKAILDAFEALIKKYGIDKTTMQEIADSVGISVGTLYNEFADKEAMIDAMMDRVEANINSTVSSMKFSSESADEQLLELLKVLTGLVENILKEKRSLADFVLSGSQNFRYVGKKIHQDFRKGTFLVDKIKSILQNGIEAGTLFMEDPREVAIAITQAFTTFSVSQVLMNDKENKDFKKRREICFKLMVRGLLAR
jgi:AcrR family transcriptional regulator